MIGVVAQTREDAGPEGSAGKSAQEKCHKEWGSPLGGQGVPVSVMKMRYCWNYFHILFYFILPPWIEVYERVRARTLRGR